MLKQVREGRSGRSGGEGDAGHVEKGEWNKEVEKIEGWKEGMLGDRGREGGKEKL